MATSEPPRSRTLSALEGRTRPPPRWFQEAPGSTPMRSGAFALASSAFSVTSAPPPRTRMPRTVPGDGAETAPSARQQASGAISSRTVLSHDVGVARFSPLVTTTLQET